MTLVMFLFFEYVVYCENVLSCKARSPHPTLFLCYSHTSIITLITWDSVIVFLSPNLHDKLFETNENLSIINLSLFFSDLGPVPVPYNLLWCLPHTKSFSKIILLQLCTMLFEFLINIHLIIRYISKQLLSIYFIVYLLIYTLYKIIHFQFNANINYHKTLKDHLKQMNLETSISILCTSIFHYCFGTIVNG